MPDLCEGGQTRCWFRVAHVGFGGANEQGLPLCFTEDANNAIDLLRVSNL